MNMKENQENGKKNNKGDTMEGFPPDSKGNSSNSRGSEAVTSNNNTMVSTI